VDKPSPRGWIVEGGSHFPLLMAGIIGWKTKMGGVGYVES
jgi:hypothetical protein